MLCEKLSVLLYFACFNAIWSFTFNEVPEDTAALLGEPAQLNCSLTCNNDCKGLVWAERTTASGNDVDIYYGEDGTFNNGNPKRDRYDIVPGTKNLLVKKVQESDAIRFICKPDRQGQPSDSKIAFLTAMGPLNTASNGVAIEGGKASVTCNVKFYKHADFPKTPSLIWDIPGADQTSGVGANDVTRTANFTVDSSHDGKSYRCRVYYTSPPPQYTNEKYASITVHYGPKMVNITTDANGGLGAIRPGEKLTCSASGKPAPTYQWIKLAGQGQPDVLNRADLIVKSEMEEENTYACVASNTVGNEVKSMRENVTFTVFVPTTTTTTTVAPTTTEIITTPLDTSSAGKTTDPKSGGSTGGGNPPTNTAAIAGGCAAGAVVIIIIIVVVIVMKRRKQKEAKDGFTADEEKQPGPPQTNPTMHPDVIRPANQNENPYDKNHEDPRNKNIENLQYADLALDDTPRSRKPIQLYDMGAADTEYAEIQHGKRNY